MQIKERTMLKLAIAGKYNP